MSDVLDPDFESSIRAALAGDADRAPQPTEWAGPRTAAISTPAGSSARWVSVAAAIILVVAAVGAMVWTSAGNDGTAMLDVSPAPTTITPVDPTTETWNTITGRPIALGDSVMLGASSELEQFGITVDTAANRQPQGVISQLREMSAAGTIPDTVVIQVGTNGPITDSELDQIVSLLPQAVTPNLVFMTLRAPVPWIADNNTRIRALPSRYPWVTVLDWESLSVNVQLCPDGTHLACGGNEAVQYYASIIRDALARVDGVQPNP